MFMKSLRSGFTYLPPFSIILALILLLLWAVLILVTRAPSQEFGPWMAVPVFCCMWSMLRREHGYLLIVTIVTLIAPYLFHISIPIIFYVALVSSGGESPFFYPVSFLWRSVHLLGVVAFLLVVLTSARAWFFTGQKANGSRLRL